jgi:hypothetical protein
MPMSVLATHERPAFSFLGRRLGRLLDTIRRMRRRTVSPAAPPKHAFTAPVPEYLRRDVGLPPLTLRPTPPVCTLGTTATPLHSPSALRLPRLPDFVPVDLDQR